MRSIYDNQFSEPILRIFKRIKNLNWKPVYLVPSTVELLSLILLLTIFIALWPYGLIPIIATFLWDLIKDSNDEIKDKSFANAMPYTIAIGIYFLIYLPFFILCWPIYAIGFIGKYFTGI